MKSATEEAKSALVSAKDDMAWFYNRDRTTTPDYKVGEKVYLEGQNLQTSRPSKKLAHKQYGPYKILEKVGKFAYCLKLPVEMSRHHPVRNVLELTLAGEDRISGQLRPPPPV